MDVKTFFIRAGNAINPLPKETLARVDALQAKVADFQSLRGPTLEAFAKRQFKPELAPAAAREYMRFMILAAVSDKPLAAPAHIGQMQRDQVQHSTFYWDNLCRDVLNRDVHNHPRELSSQNAYESTYRDTLKFYRRVFGEEAPESVWHRPKQHREFVKEMLAKDFTFRELGFSNTATSNQVREFPQRKKDGQYLPGQSQEELFNRIAARFRDRGLINWMSSGEGLGCFYKIEDGYGLEKFLERGCNFHGRVRQVYAEYLKYMVLASVADFPVVPSHVVGVFGDSHRIFTHSYRDKLCGEILESDVRNNPDLPGTKKGGSTGDNSIAERYARTLKFYREFMGEYPKEAIWGENNYPGANTNNDRLKDIPSDSELQKREEQRALEKRGQRQYLGGISSDEEESTPAQALPDQGENLDTNFVVKYGAGTGEDGNMHHPGDVARSLNPDYSYKS